jgi:hypothetical protein
MPDIAAIGLLQIILLIGPYSHQAAAFITLGKKVNTAFINVWLIAFLTAKYSFEETHVILQLMMIND